MESENTYYVKGIGMLKQSFKSEISACSQIYDESIQRGCRIKKVSELHLFLSAVIVRLIH